MSLFARLKSWRQRRSKQTGRDPRTHSRSQGDTLAARSERSELEYFKLAAPTVR